MTKLERIKNGKSWKREHLKEDQQDCSMTIGSPLHRRRSHLLLASLCIWPTLVLAQGDESWSQLPQRPARYNKEEEEEQPDSYILQGQEPFAQSPYQAKVDDASDEMYTEEEEEEEQPDSYILQGQEPFAQSPYQAKVDDASDEMYTEEEEKEKNVGLWAIVSSTCLVALGLGWLLTRPVASKYSSRDPKPNPQTQRMPSSEEEIEIPIWTPEQMAAKPIEALQERLIALRKVKKACVQKIEEVDTTDPVCYKVLTYDESQCRNFLQRLTAPLYDTLGEQPSRSCTIKYHAIPFSSVHECVDRAQEGKGNPEQNIWLEVEELKRTDNDALKGKYEATYTPKGLAPGWFQVRFYVDKNELYVQQLTIWRSSLRKAQRQEKALQKQLKARKEQASA